MKAIYISIFLLCLSFTCYADGRSIDLLQYFDQKNIDNYPTSKFIFLGWSKDGKVAYIINKGHFAVIFIIQDIVYNQIECQINIQYGDIFDIGDAKSIFDFFITSNKEIIDNFIAQYHISIINSDYYAFPIKYDNKVLSCIIDIKPQEYHDLLGEVGPYTATVTLENHENESKIINQFPANMVDYTPAGYFISPYENKAIIVVASFKDSQLIEYRFIGCDLKAGFR